MPGRLANLLKPSGPAVEAPRKKMSPAVSMAANIGMFILTAAICFGLVRGFRAFAFAGGGAPEYVLTTTRQIEPGQALSAENAAWRRVGGRAPAAAVTAPSASTSFAGYVALNRLGAGKPVKMALVGKAETSSMPTSSSLAGYVLTGEDVSEVLPYLKAGSQIDVVAIVSPEGPKASGIDPGARVATVITNAEVTGVVRTPQGARGPNARSGSVVIAVSDEQARLLGVLGHFATLEYVLSPRRIREQGQPQTVWRNIDELGLPSAPAAAPVAERSLAVARAPVSAAVPRPVPAAASISVITPSGVTQSPVNE